MCSACNLQGSILPKNILLKKGINPQSPDFSFQIDTKTHVFFWGGGKERKGSWEKMGFLEEVIMSSLGAKYKKKQEQQQQKTLSPTNSTGVQIY